MPDKITDNSIFTGAADKLIAAHDGDVALLYIYFARHPNASAEQAACDLCRTLAEISAAQEKLERMGLRGKAAAVPAPVFSEPEEKIPEYTSDDIKRRSDEDKQFSLILAEAKNLIGRPLNSVDIKILFGVYDYLALPLEVILELLHYCYELNHERYSGKRRLTVKFIEKEAYYWANHEIITLERAEEYISHQRGLWDDVAKIKALLGIHGRALTASEEENIKSWLEMGFEEEAISIAYDRTVTNTGGLKWNYMSAILRSWKERDLFDAREIEEKDGKNRPADAPGKKIDINELKSIYDKI